MHGVERSLITCSTCSVPRTVTPQVSVLTRGARPSAETSQALAGFRVLKIGLDPDRAELAAALDTRTREMFQSGLIEEVRGLLAGGCTGAEKPFESLGYKQALTVIR